MYQSWVAHLNPKLDQIHLGTMHPCKKSDIRVMTFFSMRRQFLLLVALSTCQQDQMLFALHLTFIESNLIEKARSTQNQIYHLLFGRWVSDWKNRALFYYVVN